MSTDIQVGKQSPEGIATVLDLVWQEIEESRLQGHEPDSILVSKPVFNLVCEIKSREIAHSVPLAMLGLTMTVSDELRGEEFKLC